MQAGEQVRCCRHLFFPCGSTRVTLSWFHAGSYTRLALLRIIWRIHPCNAQSLSHLWWSGAAVALVLQADVARPAM